MNVKELLEASAAKRRTVDLDPRAAWDLSIATIAEQHIGKRAEIPEAIAADLLRGLLHGLEAQLVGALQSGNYSKGHEAIVLFDQSLRNAVRAARESGPLRAQSELDRCRVELVAKKWNGAAEHDALVGLLKPGERIRAVEFWRIVLTDGREISRDEVRLYGKPTFWTNKSGSWESQFVSDADVRDAEEAAQRQANTVPAGSDSRNYDLPNGVLRR